MSLSSPPPQLEEDDVEPRRGGRARKQVERYDPANGKRKTRDGDDDDEASEEDDSDADERTPRAAQKRRSVNGKAQTGSSAKKNRKRASAPAGNGDQAVEVGATVEGIKADCPLFNALFSPDIALQPLIEDWVDTYQNAANDEVSEKASVHELVTFCIRCCGLSASVDEDEAMDVDGVVDCLETIQEQSMQTNQPSWPLINKAKPFKAFRTNLDIFIRHLVDTLALSPLLYDTPETTSHSQPIIPLLLTWLHSMSSSPLRAIRHTSAHLALKINTALCDVAASVSKDLSLKQRQREQEAKKGGVGPAAQKRMKDVEAKVKEAHERKIRLEEYMQEVFDVMFVHRVRDAVPIIRKDCLKELGHWVKRYPEHYVSTTYLNYFTRGCNDPDPWARLETVKALSALYSSETFAQNARTVTLRLVPRLIQMALRDVENNVRIICLHIIALIDKTGILADEDDGEEQREKIARVVFDMEPRVRRAVAGFWQGLWEEKVESLKGEWQGLRGNKKKRAGQVEEDEMAKRLEIKAFAGLVVSTAQSLADSHVEEDGEAGTSKTGGMLLLGGTGGEDRATAVVEALWAEFELLQGWEGLVDYLLLDHSTSEQDMWLLSEEEEDWMLKVAVACVRQEDTTDEPDEKTKILMRVLPRLITKHQGDTARMAVILQLVEHLNLSLYLELRKVPAYESLWDDLSKQFLQQTSPLVLNPAMQAIHHLAASPSASALAAQNTAKLAEVEEALFSQLRDAVGGEDVFSMSVDEDGLARLEAVLLRCALLMRSRDMVDVIESEEGGQSSVWDIVLAVAERASTGYKEEAKMVEHALQIIFLHLSWLFRRFTEADAEDATKVEALKEKRDTALEMYEKLALKEKTNAVESIRTQAFVYYVNLHMLFHVRKTGARAAAKAAPIEMADEVQHKLAGNFSAAVEQYASSRDENETADGHEFADPVRAETDYRFLQLTSVFVGALRCGVIDVDHAKEALAHLGRFSKEYDAVVRKVVDVLRDEGIYNNQPDTVRHVSQEALQQSFNLFLETDEAEPLATIALTKLLATAFVVQGSHFSIIKQIHPNDIADLHIASLDYIARKISSYVKSEQSTKNKDVKARMARKRSQALAFFKTLVLLLGPVRGKDALRIRGHAEEAMEGTGAAVGGTKAWEAYRAYERRLLGIASRDQDVAQGARQVQSRPQAPGSAPRGQDDEDREDSPLTEAPDPSPVKKRAAARDEDAAAEEEEEGEENGDEEMDADQPAEDEHGDEDEVVGGGQDSSIRLDLDLGLDENGQEPELDLDDLDIELAPIDSQGSSFGKRLASQRDKSPSLEPAVKRRKTVRRL